MFEPVHTLSGGEKGRVALTELMLHKDNVLLLDEPTNHLDMDSREVLEDALRDFPGTILAISHDRYFINRFAEKIWCLDSDGIREYLGNYDSYFEKVSRDQEPDGGDAARMTKTALDKEKKKSREEQRRLLEKKERIRSGEKEISETEQEITRMEAKMADPGTYQDAEAAAELSRQYREAQDRLEALYERWEELDNREL